MSKAVTRKPVFFKEDDNSEPVLDWLNEMKKKKRLVEHVRSRWERYLKENAKEGRNDK